MKTNKYVKILLDNGLSIKTIAKLNESQIKVLSEKFNKLETKEQITTKNTIVVGKDGGIAKLKPGQETINITPGKTPGTMEIAEDDTDLDNSLDKESGYDPYGGNSIPNDNGPSSDDGDNNNAIDGMPTTEGEMKERFKSTAQQKFFWNKCTKSGNKKSKWCKWANEFQSDTKDKDLPKKLHPEKTVKVKTEGYEKFLEDSIVEMVDRYINPAMTKSQLINSLNEKVNKS